jgi:hypothetical protein
VGTYAYDGSSSTRNETFDDPIKDPAKPGFNPAAIGEVETILNKFRSDVGWQSRDRYLSVQNKNTSGAIISETFYFGSKQINKVNMKPAEKLNRRLQAYGWGMQTRY